MILYPAIDIKDGLCVRLLRGEMSEATVFNHDPANQAKEFSETGFEWLHVVDLNGAVEGRPVNAGAVAAILGAVDMPVQLGGGIRDRATLDPWMDAGVARAVLGTAEECIEQLRAHLDAGVQQIPLVPYRFDTEQIARIAEEILPEIG